MEIEDFVKRADNAEKEIKALSNELNKLLSANPKSSSSDSSGKVPEELEKLRVENTKLKYRLGILQRATAAQKSQGSKAKSVDKTKNMLSILNKLEDIFRSAVAKSYPDLPDAPVPITPSAKFGDYQFNGAMAISGLLKGQGIKSNPREVANKVLENVEQTNIVDKLDVAGPGFVNIFLKKSFVAEQVKDLLTFGVRAPVLAENPASKKVRFHFICNFKNKRCELH